MRYESCFRIERWRPVAGLLLALACAASAAAQSPQTMHRLRDLASVAPLTAEQPGFHRTPEPNPVLPPRDDWFGFDKVQHFAFSFLVTVGGQYVLVNKADWQERDALPASAGFSAGVGVAKELHDARRPGGTGFSYKDLFWDAAGIAAASLLIAL